MLLVVVILLLAIVWWWNHRQVPSGVNRAASATTEASARTAGSTRAAFEPYNAAPSIPAAPSFPTASASSAPYGIGSAAPLANGAAPAGFTIKGNADSMLYHPPESPYYGRTIAEVWFRTEADAERAGFTRWHRKQA